MIINAKNVLVLAPHTDDGELGAGGFISKLIEGGASVTYAAFSTAEESVPDHLPKDILKTEVRAATKKLGISENNLIIFNYQVRKLNYARQEILESLTVEDALVKNVTTFRHDQTVREIYLKCKETQTSGFPIMKNNKLYSIVAKSDIMAEMIRKNHAKKLIDLGERKIIKIYPDQSLMVAFHRLKRFQISRLPVVSRLDDKKLLDAFISKDNGLRVATKTFVYELLKYRVLFDSYIIKPSPHN